MTMLYLGPGKESTFSAIIQTSIFKECKDRGASSLTFLCRQGFIYLAQKTVTNKASKHFEEYNSCIGKAQIDTIFQYLSSIKIQVAHKRKHRFIYPIFPTSYSSRQ